MLLHDLGGYAGAPAHKVQLARITGRLLVHFENASNRLMFEGELTKDGDVRALVPRVESLARLAGDNLDKLAVGGGSGQVPSKNDPPAPEDVEAVEARIMERLGADGGDDADGS